MRFSEPRQATYDAGGWHPPRGIRLQPLEIDYGPIDAAWNYSNVCSSFWRLYVNSRDGAWLELADGRRYDLAGGKAHLVPAWVRFSCHNHQRLDHLFVHFDLVGLPGVVIRQVFASPVMLGASRLFQPMVNDLRRCPWQSGHDPFDVLCQVQALLHLAIHHAWRQMTPDQLAACHAFLQSSHPMGVVLRHIEEHLDHPLRNVELARLCHFSRDHFARCFAQQVGQTPAQYIRERRVARAAQLLLFSAESIDQIAQRTGFPDRFYFTRVFTRLIGISPAAYRRAESALRGRER